MSMIVRLAALLLALAPASLAAPLPAPGVSPSSLAGPPAAPAGPEEGAEALAAARAAKQAAYAVEGEEARRAALLAAAERYAAVADTATHELEPRVEAAFRAGELLRTHGTAASADARFAQCVRLGEPSEEPDLREFAARALLERAHLQRRGDEAEAAAGTYAAVAARFGDVPRRAAQARGWRLRMLLELERLAEAEAVGAELLASIDDDPMEALRGVERISVALRDAGRPADAAALVDRLQAGLAPFLGAEDADAERLQVALQELRVTLAPANG